MSASELLAELGSGSLRDFYVKYRDDIENRYERMSDFQTISSLYKKCAEKIIHHASDITDVEGREFLSDARNFLKKDHYMVEGIGRYTRISTENWAKLKSGKWYIGFGGQWFEFNSKKKWLIFIYEIENLLEEYSGLTFYVINELLPMLLRKKDSIISSLETVSQRHSTCVAESSRLRSQIAEKDESIRRITAERDALQARINTAARAVANYEARRAAEREVPGAVTYNRANGNARVDNPEALANPLIANVNNPQGGGARKTRRHRARRTKTTKRKYHTRA